MLHFDLYVQGFAFTNAEAAQYLLSGSNNGNLEAKATDPHNKSTLVSKAYSGASLRRQAHAFVDDFVQAVDQRKPICLTKVAFKGESDRHSEIYVADFDGHDAQAITRDNSIVAAPCWVPRPPRSALHVLQAGQPLTSSITTSPRASARPSPTTAARIQPGRLAGRPAKWP